MFSHGSDRSFKASFAFFAFFILVLLELATYIVSYSYYDSRKNEYLTTMSAEWQQEFDSTINSYKMLTQSISQSITQDTNLIKILKNVNNSGDYSKAHDLLFGRYIELYKANEVHSMRIFQFQDYRGNVLVRFQKPDIYGDSVIDFRKTIQIAYDTKKAVNDFEAGKYFNAYRFVYPIVSDGVLLGSVEFGFDESALYGSLQKNFKMDAYYALDSNKIHGASKEFSTSCLPLANSRFVHGDATYSKEKLSFISRLFEGKSREIANVVAGNKEFDFSVYIDKNAYAVAFKPYIDFGGNIAGFMTLYSKDSVLPMLKKEFRYSLVISVAFVFAIWLGIVRYMLYSMQIKREMSKISVEQKAHLKTLIDTIPEYIWLKDQNGIYISCNPKFEFFFGAKESEIVGKTDYDFVAAELASFFRQKDKEAMEKDTPTVNTEWVTLAGDGKRVLLETIKTPLRTEDGELIGVLGVARDITELWKANDELQKKEQTLESAIYMKDYLYEILNTMGAVGRLLISEKPINKIKDECCALLATHGRYALAWIGDIVDDKIVITSNSYDPMGYVSRLKLSLDPNDPTSKGPSAQSVLRNETIITQSINLEYYVMWKDEAKNSGIGSSICLPLRAYADEKPFATLAIYSVKAFGFIAEEIAMLEDLAGDIGYTIASRIRRDEMSYKLEKSEYIQRLILDGMMNGVAVYEAVDDGNDFVFVNINKASEKMDDIICDDVMGKRLSVVFPGVVEMGILAVLKRVYKTGKPEYMPLCFYKDNRISGWRENYIFRLPSSEVVAIYEDATVRKKAEIALQEMNSQLEVKVSDEVAKSLKNEEEYSKLFALSPIGIGIVGVDSNIIFANKALCDMTGYTLGEIKNLSIKDLTHPDDLEKERPLIEKVFGGENDFYTIEKRLIGKQGNQIEARLTTSTKRGVNGNIEKFYGFIENITEENRIKRQSAQQKKIEDLGELARNIAHQWRQPLNALGVNTQLLSVDYSVGRINDEYIQEFTAKNMEQIEQMSKTIDTFVNFFEPDKQKIEFDIKRSIAKALTFLEQNIDNQQIDISTDFTQEEAVVFGYKNEFLQIIMSVLNNAVEALNTHRKDGKHIRVVVSKEGKMLKVSISDNAGGVPSEIIDKIFDPYFSTKHKAQGVGLGLYMSKVSIEQNMGGKFVVHNTGDGACFEIEIEGVR